LIAIILSTLFVTGTIIMLLLLRTSSQATRDNMRKPVKVLIYMGAAGLVLYLAGMLLDALRD